MKRAVASVMLALLACGCPMVAGCSSNQQEAEEVAALNGAGQPADLNIPQDQNTVGGDGDSSETSSSASYPSGTYSVGAGLPPGEYMLEPDSSGRYKLYESSQAEALIDEGLFEGVAILTVTEGQYLELDHARAIPFDDYPHVLDPERRAGTYKVGVDIPAGTYRAVAPGEDRGYWSVTDSSLPNRSVIASNTFSGADTFTVEAGQYLRFSRCNISLIG